MYLPPVVTVKRSVGDVPLSLTGASDCWNQLGTPASHRAGLAERG